MPVEICTYCEERPAVHKVRDPWGGVWGHECEICHDREPPEPDSDAPTAAERLEMDHRKARECK